MIVTTVFYALWQMQCCGKPFSVGDGVTWTVLRPREPGAQLVEIAPGGVDWIEEHHGAEFADPVSVSGTVDRIQAVWNELEFDPVRRARVAVDGSAVGVDITTADGSERGMRGGEPPAADHLSGYLVTIREASVTAGSSGTR